MYCVTHKKGNMVHVKKGGVKDADETLSPREAAKDRSQDDEPSTKDGGPASDDVAATATAAAEAAAVDADTAIAADAAVAAAAAAAAAASHLPAALSPSSAPPPSSVENAGAVHGVDAVLYVCVSLEKTWVGVGSGLCDVVGWGVLWLFLFFSHYFIAVIESVATGQAPMTLDYKCCNVVRWSDIGAAIG